jgi:hypothetical protein
MHERRDKGIEQLRRRISVSGLTRSAQQLDEAAESTCSGRTRERTIRRGICGAGDGDRTRDIRLGKPSYLRRSFEKSHDPLGILESCVTALAGARSLWMSAGIPAGIEKKNKD